jgi:GNAT superfamily N-acetyltransferase
MMQVRLAGLVDLPRLAELSKQASATDYGFYPQPIQRQIARSHDITRLLVGSIRRGQLILTAGRPAVGFITGSPNINRVAVINWLYVHPSARGQGLARQLLDDFDRRLDPSVHKVMLWTEIAPDYYRHLGWQEEAKLPNHWWGRDFFIFARYRDK